MAEETAKPVEATKDQKVLPPSDMEIGGNIEAYTYQIDEVMLVPRIKVMKDGKLVRVLDSAQQVKYAGTINAEYSDQFLKDIIDDFKAGFPQAMAKAMQEQQQKMQQQV